MNTRYDPFRAMAIMSLLMFSVTLPAFVLYSMTRR